MKQSLILLTLIGGLSAGGVTLATDKAAAAQPKQPTVNLEPKDLADDICWVAPEWRDN